MISILNFIKNVFRCIWNFTSSKIVFLGRLACKNYKLIWGALIWTLCVIYIYNNYEILKLKQNFIDYVIIIFFILFTLFPFFNEINIFGFSLKKELQKIKHFYDDQLLQVKNLILDIKVNNNQNQSTNIYNSPLPDITQIQKMQKEMENVDLKQKEESEDSLEVNESNVTLFKIRLNLEKLTDDIIRMLGIENKKYHILESINIILNNYHINEMISKRNLSFFPNNFRDIITICNRAVHGEIISDQYYNYVISSWKIYENLFNNIIISLQQNRIERYHILCPTCNYQGNAQIENKCPKCGHTTDEN